MHPVTRVSVLRPGIAHVQKQIPNNVCLKIYEHEYFQKKTSNVNKFENGKMILNWLWLTLIVQTFRNVLSVETCRKKPHNNCAQIAMWFVNLNYSNMILFSKNVSGDILYEKNDALISCKRQYTEINSSPAAYIVYLFIEQMFLDIRCYNKYFRYQKLIWMFVFKRKLFLLH